MRVDTEGGDVHQTIGLGNASDLAIAPGTKTEMIGGFGGIWIAALMVAVFPQQLSSPDQFKIIAVSEGYGVMKAP